MFRVIVELNSWATGWAKSKLAYSKGYNSKTKHFWPHVGKAKMCFRGGVFLKNCKQTAIASQIDFGLYMHMWAIVMSWEGYPPDFFWISTPFRNFQNLFHPTELGACPCMIQRFKHRFTIIDLFFLEITWFYQLPMSCGFSLKKIRCIAKYVRSLFSTSKVSKDTLNEYTTK